MAAGPGHYDAILVRYGEVFLKKGNRTRFVRQLKDNLTARLHALGEDGGKLRVVEVDGHLLVLKAGTTPMNPGTVVLTERVREVLETTFGVASFSPCFLCPREIRAIERRALEIGKRFIVGAQSFRVSASRSDKSFPIASIELNRRVGALVAEATGVRVRLRGAQAELGLKILRKTAVFYLETFQGPGGLPAGSSGKALLLLSGGIDSPVAGYLVMRRGVELEALHFESLPYTTLEARRKAEDLCKALGWFQRGMTLHIAPFGAAQRSVVQKAPRKLQVVLYRRLMLRIATELARRRGISALATGENLAQVASQTLQNLWVIDQATDMLVLRPLLSHDKAETIHLARRIGTYDISTRPFQDCCSLFVPKHPETAARLRDVECAESALPIQELIEDSLDGLQTREFGPERDVSTR